MFLEADHKHFFARILVLNEIVFAFKIAFGTILRVMFVTAFRLLFGLVCLFVVELILVNIFEFVHIVCALILVAITVVFVVLTLPSDAILRLIVLIVLFLFVIV